MLHSRDVRFDENEKDSKVAANDDLDHHFILDSSSNCEPKAPTEGQAPDEGAPE